MLHKMIQIIAGASAAVMLLASPTADAASYVQPNDSYDGYSSPAYLNQVQAAKPLWILNIGVESDDEWTVSAPERVAAGGKQAYYIKGGKLAAVNVHTGKAVWAFGQNLVSPVTYHNGELFVLSGQNRLYKVNAVTGKAVWSLDLSGAASQSGYDGRTIAYDDQRLYLHLTFGGLVAVDRKSGKLLWKEQTMYGAGQLIVTDDLLLVSASESGAITVDVVYAYDKHTGKQAWKLNSNSSPLLIDEGKVYSRDTWPPGDLDTHQLKLDVTDAATGESIAVYSYVPLAEGEDPLGSSASKIASDGESLFVQTAAGIYRYDTLQTGDVQQPELFRQSGQWIAGPYNNKLFFEDEDRQGITAVKLIDHNQVSYEGIDNPVSRLDFYNSGMYVGQTDGELYALNVTTGQAVFRYDTGKQQFDPFLVEDGVLLARAEGMIYAFKLPAQLLAPINAGSAVPGVDYTRTDAGLRIDGVTVELKPEPIMINNSLYVPLRGMAEALGATVGYDAATKAVTVTYKEKTAVASNGKNINGTVYVPVRQFAELLGVGVNWDSSARVVVVDTKAA